MPDFSFRDHVRAVILDAIVERRCGLHPWERHAERPNRLKITVEMFAALPAGPMGAAAFIAALGTVAGGAAKGPFDPLAMDVYS